VAENLLLRVPGTQIQRDFLAVYFTGKVLCYLSMIMSLPAKGMPHDDLAYYYKVASVPQPSTKKAYWSIYN
jgi:hypothetical protein